jgi:hypothetical protein
MPASVTAPVAGPPWRISARRPREARQGAAHALFERCIRDGLAPRCRPARLVDAQTERAQPGHDLGRRGRSDARLLGSGGSKGLGLVGSDGGTRPGFLGFRGCTRTCRFRRVPRRLALPAHEVRSECAFGRVLIVRPAPQPDPGHGRPSAPHHGLDVIELEPGALQATAPGGAHERASSAIALPHRAPDLGRDVAWISARPPRTRAVGRGELAPLELADEGVQGAVEHLGDFPGGNLVA